MKRNIDMSEITDGKLYTANDLVRLGCDDCKGCSACCGGMGTSILLDPYDIYMMTKGLHCTFDKLLNEAVELNMVDGMILPNLKMARDSEQCSFLDGNGRCTIHSFRPGICRLFPLGRIYEEEGFRYFLQVNECKKKNRTKMKVSQWLGISRLKTYERYISDWHTLVQAVETDLNQIQDIAQKKQIAVTFLQLFYMLPYDEEKDFYIQFYERMNRIR